MRIFPDDSYERFEFDRIRSAVSSICRSAGAKALAEELIPLVEVDAIRNLLLQTNEYCLILREGAYFPIHSFPDISKEVALLSVNNAVLQEKQFFNLRDVSDIVNNLLRFLNDRKLLLPSLYGMCDSVYITDEIIRAIDKVLDNAGMVKSSASKELGDIRKNLATARRELDKAFRAQIQKLKKQGWLADTEESVYNGRRVLAIMAEHKRNVHGLIQGSSDTGKTAFIEPIETVGLNNEVFDLMQQERREIIRILRELTREIRSHHVLISNYEHVLIAFDFVRAKAIFANQMDACMPALIKYPQIRLINARHPVLLMQNKAQGKPVVPMSCELNHTQRLIVISGPNAGGKSITLKTIGLLQMMLQSGLLVPVDPSSEMGVFRALFADIGDSQSIEYELSTYSSRLKKMKVFMDMADKKTLILIDEFGTGTDPELGGAIAEAILEDLARRRTLGVITTHYVNIKLAAERLEGVINASMLFDDETLMPKYELMMGRPGSSYTFAIAEKTGLPVELINRARKKTEKDKVTLDKMLQQIHLQQQQLKGLVDDLDDRRTKAEESKAKYDDLYGKWKERMESRKAGLEESQKLQELGRKFQVVMKEWEQSKDKKPVMEKLLRMLSAEKKKKIEKKQLAKKEKLKKEVLEKKRAQITVGSKVKLLNGKQTGIVEKILQNKASVTFGNLKTIASLENLEVVE